MEGGRDKHKQTNKQTDLFGKWIWLGQFFCQHSHILQEERTVIATAPSPSVNGCEKDLRLKEDHN